MAKSEIQEQIPVNATPMASVEPEPNPFHQVVPEHTTGSVVVVERARIKTTRLSESVYPKGNAVMLAYMLKVPTPEAVFQIYNDYIVIKNLVYTFDREHEESWFEAHPLAVLLVSGEKNRPTREELRDNYREYCCRLAHHKYHYEMTHKMRTAAFINLVQMSRFQGKTKQKDIASITRWNLVNRSSADMKAYPQPTGSINSLTQAAKYAYGKTAAGVTVLAMPLYDTTVYGNLGNHAGSLKDGIVDVKPDANSIQAADTAGFVSKDSDFYEFMKHSELIVSEYYDIKPFDILNAATLVVTGKGASDKDAYISLQRDGRKRFYDSNPQLQTSITKQAWDAFNHWSNILANQFPEMRDPAHDIRVLYEELKFVEQSPDNVEMYNAIIESDFYDLTSLRNAMRYMRDGKANTATIVRQSLLVGNVTPDDSPNRRSLITDRLLSREANVFKLNFDRYPFHKDTASEWIREAKKWPGLTPRMFPDADPTSASNQAALVAGAISSDGHVVSQAEGFMNSGKYASYFDYATHQTLDASKSTVGLSAIGTDFAKKVVDNREGFVCAEDPSQVFVKLSQFIDTSDPYQCGFYLLNEVPDAARSEWEQFVSELQSYLGAAIDPALTKTDALDKLSPFTSYLDGVPISISHKKDEPGPVKNTLPVFATTDWYSMIFVGDMPFMLPQARSAMNSFAMPEELTNAYGENDSAIGNPSTGVSALSRKRQALTEIAAMELLNQLSTTEGDDKVIQEAALESTMLADVAPASEGEEASTYAFSTSQMSENVQQVDPTKAKFYLRRTTRQDVKGAIVDYSGNGDMPAGAARAEFVAMDAVVDSDKDDFGVIHGVIQFFDKAGKLMESWSRYVTFVAEALTTVYKGTQALHAGPNLTEAQAVGLERAFEGASSLATSWQKISNWTSLVAEAAKKGSFWQTFYTVLDGTFDIDPKGYMLGLQIPAAAIAQRVTANSKASAQAKAAAKAIQHPENVDSLTEPTASTKQPATTSRTGDGYEALLGVWRYATNVVRDGQQSARFKDFYDGNSSSEKIVNPAALLASLMSSRWNQEGALRLYMFNPQYGPVAICADPIPEDADYGFDPDIATSDTLLAAGSVSALVPRMGIFQTDKTGTPARRNQRSSYQSTQASAHLWRWYVKSFSFQQAKFRDGRPVVQDGDPIAFNDESKVRWPLSMFAQLVVTFAGSGDIDYFDSAVAKAVEPAGLDVSKQAPVTVDGLVFVPHKLLVKKMHNRSGDITGANTEKQSGEGKILSNNYSNLGGGSKRGASGEGRSQSNGRKGSKKKSEKKIRPHNGRNDELSAETLAGGALKVSETGPNDASSSEVDKGAERKMAAGPKSLPMSLMN